MVGVMLLVVFLLPTVRCNGGSNGDGIMPSRDTRNIRADFEITSQAEPQDVNTDDNFFGEYAPRHNQVNGNNGSSENNNNYNNTNRHNSGSNSNNNNNNNNDNGSSSNNNSSSSSSSNNNEGDDDGSNNSNSNSNNNNNNEIDYLSCKISSGTFAFLGLFFPCSLMACLSCTDLLPSPTQILPEPETTVEEDPGVYEPLIGDKNDSVRVKRSRLWGKILRFCRSFSRLCIILLPSFVCAGVFGSGAWFLCRMVLETSLVGGQDGSFPVGGDGDFE